MVGLKLEEFKMNNLTTWFLNSENQQVSENITDVPPITFNGNGKPLTNWKITGSQAGVGDATANLFDINAATQGYKINIIFSGAEAAVQEEPSIEFIEDSDFLIIPQSFLGFSKGETRIQIMNCSLVISVQCLF